MSTSFGLSPLIKPREKCWGSSATSCCHQPHFILGRMYLRNTQKQALLSSRKRSSGTAENSASIICVNTRELRGERFSFSEPVQIAERADAKVGSQASSFKLA
jgi:hypothetical protein